MASKNTESADGLNGALLKVNTSLVDGFVEIALPKLTKVLDTDLIIMGTTGKGSQLNKWIGTVSSTVAQKASCPTLLIPNGVQYKGFNNILFASDFQADDEVTIQQLLNLAAMYEANVHFVHVADTSDSDHNWHPIPMESLIREKAPNSTFKMVTLKNNSPLEAINQYSKENKIDLVALTTFRRSFIANMLHKSMTKQLIFNSKIPLMVLHLER